eukprot:3755068-Amphidinium_carterae.1
MAKASLSRSQRGGRAWVTSSKVLTSDGGKTQLEEVRRAHQHRAPKRLRVLCLHSVLQEMPWTPCLE